MNNQVSAQLNKLRQIVFTRDTVVTLGQSIRILITLLQETLKLLWLVFCMVLVGFEWAGKQAIAAGQSLKTWSTRLPEMNSEQTASELAVETGKTLLTTAQRAIEQMMTHAKQQVGLSVESSQAVTTGIAGAEENKS
jgi:hypothetical protein